MIQKCSIENISNNMHYIGLIILIFIIIITILYFIKITKYSSDNNKIVEKYNTNSEYKVSAEYLNTNGTSPLNQDADSHKDVRSPTLNLIKTSTATFRPCQIHFNNDGTSKYVYEDGWQEFNTLTSQEDNSVYNVPYKKFANDNNNIGEFENFNETTKCFKQKNRRISLNTYKYKSNDLIKYKPDTYIAVQFKNDENVVGTDLFMQMFFDKQSGDTSLNNYKNSSLDSICSYNYKRDLSLGNFNLYRLTLAPVSNNQNIPIDPNSIKDAIITSIDSITIENEDNSEFRIHNKEYTNTKLPELLSSNSSFYLIQNGNITYRIVKNELTQQQINDGINVKIYKFNRNLDCSDQVIKSYETSSVRLKSEILISVEPYISNIINPENSTIPNDIIITESEIKKIIEDNAAIKGIINEMSTDVITKCFNNVMKNRYDTKDELIEYIYNFSRKLIAISNRTLVSDIIDLMKINKDNTDRKNIFLDRFNTIQKFIPLYQTGDRDSVRQELFNELAKDIGIENYQISLYNYTNLQPVKYDVQPFTLENVYEIKIYTIDTVDKTITFENDTICDILIVGGGGGGGMDMGGGGGGGGVIELTKFTIKKGTHRIVVGRGGNGAPAAGTNGQAYGHEYRINGTKGEDSSFVGYTAIGGGYGGSSYQDYYLRGQGGNGGSGGGGSGYCYTENSNRAGKGTSGQGNNGGYGSGAWHAGGGGGAGEAGGGPNSIAHGGRGKLSNILGTSYYWGGGGGGSSWGPQSGNGGLGGGGGGSLGHGGGSTTGGQGYVNGSPGGEGVNTPGGNGGSHTGGGGGGGAHYSYNNKGGDGGSGIVIVKYLKIPQVVSTSTIKREVVINTNSNSNTNNNNLQDNVPKIFMKNKDTQVTLNDNNIVTLQKNKSYYIQPLSLNNKNALIEYSQIYNINDNTYKYELTNANSANQKHVVTFPNNTLCHVVIVAGGGSGGENGGCEGGGGGGGGGVVYATVVFRKNVEYIFEVGNGGSMDGYNNEGITVYSEPNFRGSAVVKGVGSYDMFGHGEAGIGLANDDISSIRIPNGYSVTLYYHAHFSGPTITLTADTPYLPSWFDNQTSGFVVNKTRRTSGTGISGNNSLIYDRDKKFLNIVAYGGGAGGMYGGIAGGSGGGGSGHGGDNPAGDVLNRNSNDAFGVIDYVSYGNKGGMGYTWTRGSSGGGGGGAGKTGNSLASESKSYSSLGSNRYNGSDGGDGISLSSIKEFKDLRNAANIILGGGGGGASGMDCHRDWRTVMGNSGGLGGTGGGGRGGNRNNPQPGVMGLGGGGGGSSHAAPGRGGSGVIYIYRKIELNTIFEIPTNTLKISYDIEDDTPVNLNNARNNKNLINQEPIIKTPLLRNNNNYTYMLGTKTDEINPYFKCRITITSLSASFNPTFATKSGNTFVKISDSNYEFKYIEDIKPNDIVLKVFEVLFYKNVSGDIYMILEGYANIFNIKGVSNINSLLSLYNNKLSSFLLRKENYINNLFGLQDYDKNVQQKINNRVRIFIDNNNLMNYTGLRDDDACRKLPALKEIYNALYLYNSKDASIKPKIIFNNSKKILDIVGAFNINHVSYENPINKQAVNMESYYHPQPISNNYVYFKYPE